MSVHQYRWFYLLIAGILISSWIILGLQNKRVDENALKNAGKTGEDWLTYGLNYRRNPVQSAETDRCGQCEPSGTVVVL